MVLLCKQMNWDYYTYLAQPEWFINLLRLTNSIEAQYQETQNKIAERRARR